MNPDSWPWRTIAPLKPGVPEGTLYDTVQLEGATMHCATVLLKKTGIVFSCWAKEEGRVPIGDMFCAAGADPVEVHRHNSDPNFLARQLVAYQRTGRFTSVGEEVLTDAVMLKILLEQD